MGQPRTPPGRRPPGLRVEPLEDRTTPAALPPGFTEAAVAEGLVKATAMEVAPNGDLWVTQQDGLVKRFRPGTTAADVVADVAALGLRNEGERGLLGITFDPNYAANKWVYLYYTSSDAPNPHNRVSRFTVADGNPADYSLADTDAAVPGPDEAVILDLDPLSGATNHNGGAIHFGPDGKLYVAVGDNANGSHAQSLNNRHGKILRVNPDGTIPADNPASVAGIPGTTTGANRAIWAAGLRNPYTFTFQPGTGRMFVNDVGQGTWEEVNEGGAGRNFGWPATEGDFSQPSYPNFTRPVYAYSHGGGTFQGYAITGGAFYSPAAAQFPAEYAGDYFFADYVNDWVNVVDADGTNPRRFATGAQSTVDLRVTADGGLLYLGYDSGKAFRVTYTASQAPAITQQPQNATALAGGTATFAVAASGTGPLSYRWQKLNGSTWADLADGTGVSGAATATLTLTQVDAADAGQYRAVATNSAGSAVSNAAALTVTANQAPTAAVSITSGLTSGKFVAGQPVGFSGSATDPEDGALGAGAFTWRVDYITSIGSGNPAVRPFVPEVAGQPGGTFTPATTGPYTLTDVAYRVTLTARDSAGLATTATVDVAPNVSTITVQTSPAGLTVTVDGQPYTAPAVIPSVVGFERPIGAPTPQTAGGTTYAFQSWSDGGAATHTIVTPAADTTYTAAFVPAPYVPGLKAEFFDFSAALSALPDLTGRAPDVTRTDVRLNYPSTSAAWTGLPAGFADTFASRHTGYLRVDAPGDYTLSVNSDDGSKVWLGGQLVIDNDGLHAMRERSATRTLAAGFHPIRVEFFENGGGAGLILSWAGPGIAKQVVPAGRLFRAPGPAFRQDPGADGLVVLEAENHHANVARGGASWAAYTAAGYSGGGAVQAVPNTGVNNNTGYVAASPRLDFRVEFARAGVHYVWVRGAGPSGADDSVHVGLDGAAVATADRVTGFGTGYSWTRSTMDGPVATIDVPAPGVHTVNLWMREDGTVVDKLLLTTTPGYAPTNGGPAESPQPGGPAAKAAGPAAFAASAGDGLAVTLYDNRDFTGPAVTRVDPVVNFAWGTRGPAPGIGADTFSARWTGQVVPEFSEPYTFYTVSDDGVRLWVDGRLLVDNWTNHSATEDRGTVTLEAGRRYDVRMEYYENTGRATARLLWSSPSRPKQVVPTARLFSAVAAPPAAPSGLAAAAVSESAVRLTWADNSADETGFRVERSADGATFAAVGTVGPDVTAFDDAGLAAAATYSYRVVAVNAAGESGPAGPVGVRTLDRVVTVGTTAQLRQAVAAATPGTRVLVRPGVYDGGNYFADVRGEAGRPVVVAAADPADKPVFRGGAEGLHFSDVAYLELRDLVVEGASQNGINIDDGGTYDTPSHHVTLTGLVVRNVGTTGNQDGIKLSGVRDFRIDGVTVANWGGGGSAVDMVGCHDGVIAGSVFRHTPGMAGGTGVQAKGGTTRVAVRDNRFEHAGARAVQIGGSTGLEYFRPQPPAGYEAKDVTAEGNVVIGSQAAVTFVNVDGAVARFNTIYRPGRWVIRILQETTAPGFVPSRNGVFADNLVVFRAGELATAVNVGPNAAPETFRFDRNWWYCENDPARSRPALPAPEAGGTYGADPQLVDAGAGDLRPRPGSPAAGVGAYAPRG